MAQGQAKDPTKRGVMIWVETDGTVYWSTAETAIPTHGDGANRNDKYIDNSKTYRSVIKTNSIGVEFVGNYPDVAKPATREQVRAWLILVRFLQERYDIAAETSMPTTGSTSRIAATAKAASSRRSRASSPTSRESKLGRSPSD